MAPVLRLMTDIVAFDLTHVYLMLDVMDRRDESAGEPRQKNSVLRLTLPECHLFLKALREFKSQDGSIEVTTPVIEEAKRAQGQKSGAVPRSVEISGKLRDMARPELAASDQARETNLGDIIEKLNAKAPAAAAR